jgi:hypothetical protein
VLLCKPYRIFSFNWDSYPYIKTAVIKDEILRPFYKKTELVQRLLANQCELCHSTEDVEVHHVRKLADIGVCQGH